MNRLLALSISLLLAGSVARAENYAVLFSGGGDPDNNFSRYYKETMRMWEICTGTLGYSVDNVFVLAADGTSPGRDQPVLDEDDHVVGHINSDWGAITAAGGHIASASPANLQTTLTGLGSGLTSQDTLYFWAYDHGSNPTAVPPLGVATGQDEGRLVGWYGEIPDDVFASWANPIQVGTKLFVFGECYSGDMEDDLDLSGQSFAAWASAWNQPSLTGVYPDGSTVGWVQAWSDGLEVGLRSTHELGQYAIDHNPYFGTGGTAQEQELSGFRGANFLIATGPAVIPAPAAILLAVLGLGGVGGLRRKRVL